MPRGRKKVNLSIDEQLTNIEQEILDCKEKIKFLQQKKSELTAAKEQEDLQRLYDAVKKSGRTVEEVIDHINANENV